VNAILTVRDLVKRFGNLAAVDGVDLEIAEGTVTALIGPNGAGKTTLFNLMTGALRADRGSVRLKGGMLTGLAPEQVVWAGLVRTFQITQVFPGLTAIDGVTVARLARLGRAWHPFRLAHREEAARRDAATLLEAVGLSALAGRIVATLSHADQKLVEVAMALACDPLVLLLDEPTGGLAPEETSGVVRLLQHVASARGTTVLLIEHDMEAVFAVAQRIVVLHQGKVLADDKPEAVRRNSAVREVYLGKRFTDSH
jgi:branched-chain amino acid transport system ATP-binding protein